MVLLVMVALAMLSLSTIELRSSANDRAMEEAKANARMALMIAIGEIQKSLGPDQRVNANASIFTETQTNRSQWLGVYKSWTDEQKLRPSEPEFIRWLVSGDSQILTTKDAYAGAKVADDMVKLVGEGTLGNDRDESYHVMAGKTQLDSQNAIAWWVGDEASKARIPGPVADAESAVSARSRMMAIQRVGLERLDSYNRIAPDEEKLDHIVTFPTLDLLAGSTKSPHFHDVTTDSSIVMTNVREGGLRKDLSMFLNRPIPTSSDPEPLYTVQGMNGITMQELWTYYNLWNEIEYLGSPLIHPDGGSIPADTPTLVSKTDHLTAVNDPFFPYRRLTMMRASWVVSHMSRLEDVPSTGKTEHQLYVVVDPVLTIWNPFDVAVKIEPNAFSGYKFWGMPYEVAIHKGAQRKLYSMNSIFGGGQILSLIHGRVEPIVLRPGEALVISQGTRDETIVRSNSKTTDIRLGWNFGAGFRFPVKGFSGSAETVLKHEYRPRSNGHFGWGLTEFLQYQGVPGSAYSSSSVWTGGLIIDRSSPSSRDPRLQATQAPEMFPVIESELGATYTLGEIENRKRPTMIYSLDMKTEFDPVNDGNFQGRFRLRHNPKLPGYDLQSFDDNTIAASPMQISVKSLNSWKDVILDVTKNGQGYVGGSYSAEFGNPYMVTHSIPREPIHSIAAFQHAVANGSPRQRSEPGVGSPAKQYFLQPSITHAIGNSFAPSFMAGDATEGTLNNGPAADHSYLVNQALWDTWYFSSIAPQTSKSWEKNGNARTQRKVFEDFIGITDSSKSSPLPINHFKPWAKDEKVALESLFSGDLPSPEATAKSASYLMLTGGFNVNSTSVDAWRLLLSGLRNSQIARSDPRNSGDEILEKSENTIVASLLTPFGEAIVDKDLNDPKTPEQWKGYRELTDSQVDELAESMVKQVRLRGPFLSLADFVNRRLETTGKLSLSGTVQAALDDEEVSINQDFFKNSRNVTEAQATAAGLLNPAAEAGAAAVGIPGYVKQADILTSIGAYLTPRSDTFRVRAYGETKSADGTRVIARAWCEAVVQRFPDYIDTSDTAELKQANLTKKVNKDFGRRLKVISFRWLGAKDI
jgi:hypothetical protein